MTTTATIPIEEFETWLEPSEVTAIFVTAGWTHNEARGWLIRRLRDGLIRGCAHEILVGQSAHETQHAHQLVTRDAWENLNAQTYSFWNGGDHGYLIRAGFGTPDSQVRLYGVRICRIEVNQKLPAAVKEAVAPKATSKLAVHVSTSAAKPSLAQPTRAPSFKAGRPPTEDEIRAKADEMRARSNMTGRDIASAMHHEPGFENVATRDVRELLKGRYPRTGRAGIKSAQ